MSLKEKQQLLAELTALEEKLKYDKFHNYYFQDHKLNEEGQDISREKYYKQVEFINATANYRELAFVASNRLGKTESGSFIITAIATKDYPEWYNGRKFPEGKALNILVLGKTNESVRDVIQKKLVGPLYDMGSGMIPKERLRSDMCRRKTGVPDALNDIYVEDIYGNLNHIQFGSYKKGEDVVMGTEYDVVWLDEECLNQTLYGELLMRTATTKGFVFTTFTPLEGMTEGILKFIPDMTFPKDGIVRDEDGKPNGKFVIHCGWECAPHLSEEDKADIKKRFTGPELQARVYGIPTVGAGQVYPFQEESIVVEPFPIPHWWPRAYGLDVGWNCTAGIWGAQDPESGVIYIYSEYYGVKDSPVVHAEAIKSRGDTLYGAIDPASQGSSQIDGRSLFNLYFDQGLNILPADNAVEAGISTCYQAFQTGQLKIFNNCKKLLTELRLYRRNEDTGKVYKQNDHGPDAMRYLVQTAHSVFTVVPTEDDDDFMPTFNQHDDVDPVTGY